MLGDALARTLPRLRRQAESMMRDTCRVTTPGPRGPKDPVTGTYPDPVPITVYEGKCRVRNAYPAPQNAQSGEATYAVDQFTLSLPIFGSEAVGDGMNVEITASSYDPAAVGARFTIVGPHSQTHSTARRFPVKVVTRDVR